MRIRQLAGVALFDWNRYSNALRSRNPEWVGLCNRYEKLEASPDGTGVKCDWRFTSELHAPKVVRGLGRRLMRRALSDYPISLESSPRSSIVEGTPDVSFIIGHRGSQRLPHLLAVLQSIAAQCEARVECIVVEQSCAPEVDRQLPQWVRYVHTRLSDPEALYSRSWAFNVGARLARGRLLVLQDNDLLVPREYASQLMARYLQGFEVVNIKRFIFYLGQKETQRLFSTGARPIPAFSPEEVLQNAQGGGSI
ncbi:MAG: glycosyltransferase family 2 protein, partial [Blastocatellia bacterium]